MIDGSLTDLAIADRTPLPNHAAGLAHGDTERHELASRQFASLAFRMARHCASDHVAASGTSVHTVINARVEGRWCVMSDELDDYEEGEERAEGGRRSLTESWCWPTRRS